MKKTILFAFIGISLVLTGCTFETPTIDQDIALPTNNTNNESDVLVNQDIAPPINNISSNWPTLTTTGREYSLKYPNDWTMITEEAYDLYILSEDNELIRMLRQKNDKNLSIKDWLTTSFPNSSKYSSTTYNDNLAYKDESRSTVFFKLQSNEILTIIYITNDGPNAVAGSKHKDQFLGLLNSIDIRK